MGKVKRNRGRHRVNHPAEVSSAERASEQQQQGEAFEHGDQRNSIWDKLSASEPFEREMACRTLAHIEFDEELIKKVVGEQLAKRLIILLGDPFLVVREAAIMALRKMCSCDSKTKYCNHLVSEGVMPALIGHLRECFQGLQAGTNMAALNEAQATKSQLLSATEEALNLLWCLCEQTQSAVDAFNEEALLAMVVYFLQLQYFPLSLVTAAAQCLHIVTEDNTTAIHSLCATSDSMALLLQHLQTVGEEIGSPVGLWYLLKTSVAGVLYNMLPLLQEPVYTTTLRAMLSVLVTVLDVEIVPLLLQLPITPSDDQKEQQEEQLTAAQNGSVGYNAPPNSGSSGLQCGGENGDGAAVLGVQEVSAGGSSSIITLSTPPTPAKKLSEVETVLSSQQLALELVVNLCSMEDEDQWDDVEGEEGGADMEVDETDTTPHGSTLQSLVVHSLAEFGLFTKVWKICCSVNRRTYELCEAAEGGEEIAKIMNVLQGRSLYALQNLLTLLPQDSLGGKDQVWGVWHTLLELLQQEGRFLHADALVGVLGVLLEKLSAYGSVGIMVEDLQFLCELGLQSPSPHVRSGIMQQLGVLGKMTAMNISSPASEGVLNAIGTTLRNSVSQDPHLWVVAQALDAVFDVFGEDNCPLDLYQSLGMASVLKTTAATFIHRTVSERNDIKSHRKIVQSAQSNLPAFIQYMTAKIKCKH